MLVVHDEAAQLAAQEAPKWCAKLAVLQLCVCWLSPSRPFAGPRFFDLSEARSRPYRRRGRFSFFDLSEARSRPYRRRGRSSAVSTCICWLRKSKPVSILKSLRMPPVEQRSCCASTERGGSSSRECRSERFSCLPCCIRDILLDYLVLLLSAQAEETQLRLFQPPPPALAQLLLDRLCCLLCWTRKRCKL